MAEIPKIVGQRLRAMAAVGEHPDPNLLGAFMDRTLAKGEQVRVLEHLSRCMSCREIISLAATQPAIADVVSAVPASTSTGWLAWPVLRWGAAVACVMVIGAVVTLRQQQSRQLAATTQLPGRSLAQNVDETSLNSEQIVSRQAASVAKPTAPNALEMADAGPGPQVVPGRAKPAIAQETEVNTEVNREIRGAGNLGPPVEGSNATVVPLVSTNFPPRWTLTSDGTLQRSRDSGRSWQTVPVPNKTMLRALAANGQDIWVGGAAGALFHSSDAGRHWIQVRPTVNGEALALDIIGVEFADPAHGKLTVADPEAQALNRGSKSEQTLQQYNFPVDSSGGNVEVRKTPGPAVSGEHTWSTADAGQTWQKQ
jgi:Putative zinc-finger